MVLKIMPYKVSAFGASDVGLVRQNNEDYFAEIPNLHFYALADGMGGHRAGEVASKEAVTSLVNILNKSLESTDESLDLSEMHGIIQYAIEHANQVVYKMGLKEPELRGMGTTLCCLFFNPQGMIYAHVGDSRIYRLREGKLEQLTKDDSLIRQLRDAGKIDKNGDQEVLYKGIITKAIGTGKEVDPSVHIGEILDNDLYLMCSDGLSDMLSLREIEEILNQTTNIHQACQRLINGAKEKGGFDNITVVLAKVEEIHETKNLS